MQRFETYVPVVNCLDDACLEAGVFLWLCVFLLLRLQARVAVRACGGLLETLVFFFFCFGEVNVKAFLFATLAFACLTLLLLSLLINV